MLLSGSRNWSRVLRRVGFVLLPLLLAGCNGIDMGINPGPDVRKEQGPLTKPPPGVLRGTAM